MNVINRLKEMGVSVYEVGTLNYLCRTPKGHAFSAVYGYDDLWNCYCWKCCFDGCNTINYFLEEDNLIEAISNYVNKRRTK